MTTHRAQLRAAVRDLSDRGLKCSAKWAAEQLVGLAGGPLDDEAGTSDAPMSPAEEVGSREEEDQLLLAKAYFDLNEFKRAAHALRVARGASGRFLRWYSLFLAGQKRQAEEEAEERSGGAGAPGSLLGKPRASNQHLPLLNAELTAARESEGLDGFGHYLHGIVLRELAQPALAREALLRAVSAYPCLWSAWTALSSLSGADEAPLELPDTWVASFFLAHQATEAHDSARAVSLYESLLVQWPRSLHVQSQLALARYNLRDFEEAQQRFEELLAEDPYRLDGVDTYSNILYVREEKRKLSALAHSCVSTDKYRPEACCVVGNYYSLKGAHEKAVLYFRRALKLDANFLSAWTLMGHEYVELKNTAAAVDAYRRAVEIDAKDYRAWYGLGQTYEILAMPFYALFYYRKATALRPYDSRMWCAMAGCYKQLHRRAEAIQCYHRAEKNDDREGIAFTELARLYRENGEDAQAAGYYERMVAQREAHGEAVGKELSEARVPRPQPATRRRKRARRRVQRSRDPRRSSSSAPTRRARATSTPRRPSASACSTSASPKGTKTARARDTPPTRPPRCE
uniref:Cdc23 domain-containing protein n=1 Tax=Emiliania huxleyi TaxID=2903 RepID=A0A7S3STY6_EMIHU